MTAAVPHPLRAPDADRPAVDIDEGFRKSLAGTFYDSFYANVTPELRRWRAVGARQKCENIVRLSSGLRPRSVLEIGAGICSVTSRLAELGFAEEFNVLEVSPSAVEYIRANVRIPRLRRVFLRDSARTGLPDRGVDLGILSHVLEHLDRPVPVLREALRVCRRVIFEVPLEDCGIERFDWDLRGQITGAQRTPHPDGHVQFLNHRTARLLVKDAGGRLLRERTYFPDLAVATYGKHGWRRTVALMRHALYDQAFAATGSRFVITHYGALVEREPVEGSGA